MRTIFFLSCTLTLLVSCGTKVPVSSNDYKNNYKVKQFFNQFDKSGFLTTIASKRNNVEDYVKEIKNKNIENNDIETMYADVQNSYNEVLATMSSDVNTINNLLDFGTLNATNRYQAALKEAEEKETIFINSAFRLLNPDEETSFLGDLFNAVLDFIPGAKQIQDIYLNKLKADLQNKINDANWNDWSSI